MIGIGITQTRVGALLSVQGMPAAITAPIATQTSALGVNPLTVDLLLPDAIVHSVNKLRAQRTNDEISLGVPNWNGSSLAVDMQNAGDDGSSVAFSVLNNPMPSAKNYVRFAEESGDATLQTRGSVVSPWSNVILANFAATGQNNITTLSGTSWIGQNINGVPYPGFFTGAYFANHPEQPVANFAQGGSGLDYFASQISAILAQKAKLHFDCNGQNDFMSGEFTGYNGTDQQNFDAYVAKRFGLYDQIKANGTAIVTMTLTRRNATDNPSYNATYNAHIGAFNALLRQKLSEGYFIGLLDLAADPTLGDAGTFNPGDPWTSDGLHLTEAASGPTTAGHYIAYQHFAPMMDGVYATIGTGQPPEDLVSTFSLQSSPVTVTEGNSGTTSVVFTVTRVGALTQSASVDWAVTGSGTNPASANDFVGGAYPTGTLAFAANDTSKTISVPVQGDTTVETDETFTVTLSNPKVTGKIGSQATQTGTIVNDDSGSGGSGVAFDPSAIGNAITLSNNNKTATCTGANQLARLTKQVAKNSGLYYFEATFQSLTGNNGFQGFYISQTDLTGYNGSIPGNTNSTACTSGFDSSNTLLRAEAGGLSTPGAAVSWTIPVTFGCLIDTSGPSMTLYLGGTDGSHGLLSTSASALAGAIVIGMFFNGATLTVNTAGPFAYSVPSGAQLLGS